MPRSHAPYPPEFRRQLVELARAGRTPEELAKEFEPSSESIRTWVRQAARDEGQGDSGLTTEEREELRRLRRECKQLRVEREILSKAATWFAREADSKPPRSSHSWGQVTLPGLSSVAAIPAGSYHPFRHQPQKWKLWTETGGNFAPKYAPSSGERESRLPNCPTQE